MQHISAQNLLAQYQVVLDAFFQSSPDANWELAEILAQFFAEEQLINLIQQLLKDDCALAEIASRSYQHGNGFLKVVLLEQCYKLRLHIWFPGHACEENIHDHRWSFASYIAAGQLNSEIWCDDAQGLTFQEFEYHAATSTHAPFKRDCGEKTLKLHCAQVNQVGESYVMPKGKLHRIINPGHQLVATVMCSAPTEQGTTRLIPMHAGIDPNIQPPKTTVSQLRTAFQQFLILRSQDQHHAA